MKFQILHLRPINKGQLFKPLNKHFMSIRKVNLAFLLTFVFLAGCESSKQITITNSWLNKEKLKDKSLKTIYIMGLFKSREVNSTLEFVLAKEATERRYIVFRNQEELPFKFDNPEQQKELVLEKVKSLGCDAIFVSALKKVNSQTRYVSTSSIGVSTGGYYPMNGYQNNFNNYYAGYYAETSLSGYYETDNEYFFESNLYDVNTLDLLWSVQSKSYNPTDVEKVSKEYCDELFKLLEKEKDFKGRKTEVK